MIIPNFVVFEGGDGSGSTTQITLLEKRFTREGDALPALWTTCEPTKGTVGVLIRSVLCGETVLRQETLARLFSADREEHIFAADGVLEHCSRGELVVSDRYTLSSLVYQGISCGDDLPTLLNDGFPAPELLFFFDVSPEIALKRIENRCVKEIFEHLDFQVKAQERYKALLSWCEAKGSRVVSVDASKTPEAAAEDVWEELQKLPIMKRGT